MSSRENASQVASRGSGSGQQAGGPLLDDELDGENDDTQKDKYLTFRLAEEEYGVEIAHVIEIVGIQHIAAVPDMPPFLKGVINLRGQVIPVMDVRMRLSMPERANDERTCVVVTRVDEYLVGLIVDTVCEVITIPQENVSPPPRVARAASARYIRGIGKVGEQVKMLLEVDRLLFDEEMGALGELSARQPA